MNNWHSGSSDFEDFDDNFINMEPIPLSVFKNRIMVIDNADDSTKKQIDVRKIDAVDNIDEELSNVLLDTEENNISLAQKTSVCETLQAETVPPKGHNKKNNKEKTKINRSTKRTVVRSKNNKKGKRKTKRSKKQRKNKDEPENHEIDDQKYVIKLPKVDTRSEIQVLLSFLRINEDEILHDLVQEPVFIYGRNIQN